MPALHQWDYLFAFGVLFAALDAYNIGANDVANSFATSISSRSLTLRQATVLAAICEFLGGVLAGSRVAGTIKNGIISLSTFKNNAGVELLAFVCALTASATWLMIATRKGWPVSTTYSIVSALAGVGVALDGPGAVNWGWNNGKGIATIFAGFGIAPGISAGFGATVYLITKYAVLKRKDPLKAGLIMSPIYFFTVAVILTMSIVYKGAPQLKLNKLPQTTIALAIVLTGVVIACLSAIFWLPYVYSKVIKRDYTLRWYHFFYGPLLWRRAAPPPPPEGARHVPDYRIYDRDDEHEQPATQTRANPVSEDSTEGEGAPLEANVTATSQEKDKDIESAPSPSLPKGKPYVSALEDLEKDDHKIEGAIILPRNLWILFRYKLPKLLLHGTSANKNSVDIHAMQSHKGKGKEGDRMMKMYEQAAQYDNETEHLYSFLQVMTACTNSFAHGSNDLANAVGPFAAIYYVWSTGMVTPANTVTPVWIFVAGALMLVIGLATYGYNIMAVLGNRLTMHSPSRGFSMELGSSITVLLASQYGIPVSTTMCITGSTAGVGLVSGGVKSLNWRAFAWIFLGWVLTVPIAGTAAGCLTGILINAPHW
ncbi:solute carrier family 20 (sodium-dependent phosphate transporter) [Cryptococcus gattii E566]|uniref:Phosphate transporter n=2 Tax=Cryptococcus gattii TaxID=37769 RepID=E6R5J9_CRYGW|nr:Sodium:inorganic phosphate symporter, putative [Cryptococcus gattii WM276]ADV21575.1 Sodium:inorganic phosphate symporter, putative [Cryptococcus gattii WM276]KIR81032.1 solute carrier family 20 (sodium-dependent phosphate transporter) [Cryptococcus gattii EJB2]KIY34066.1 solute carrier family 20 (sodium-dependent phosphate transporter) [Cryptococcus gattii E566]KJE03805.1 solute carrier family 20 (sodium-dependent phosphate transporter) [Cryptococcus gattii NT-10]